MKEKISFSKIRGVTVWEACDFCKEKRRIPGGKYRHEGEVIDCPCCDGRGTTPIVISMTQFHKLLTMTKKRVTTRYGKQRPQRRV
jgi:hypothetical protein